MNRLRTWLLGMIGLLALTSCGLFKPERPYHQGDRRDPLVLDQQHPERRSGAEKKECAVIDYLFPWRLARCERE